MEGISLSADRDIRVNVEALAVAETDDPDNEGLQSDSIDSHWKDSDFKHFDRGLNCNWSDGYRAEGEYFLTQIASEYYEG